jgi:Rieske 2Fe-2S family protein
MVTTVRPETSPVRTLPGRYYADPEIFRLEQQRIFERSWYCVGRADSIAEPGAFFLATVGGENIVVLRDREDEVRAFYNVCRHRGSRVCLQESGRLKGSMQCRYHAWTYALDGRLIGAPNMKEDPTFDKSGYGLVPASLQLWEGLIYLNLAPEGERESLSDQLGETYSRYARYHMGELAVGATITYDVKANWKLIHENFSECGHCPVMHPELSALVPSFKAGVVSTYGGNGAELGAGVESLTPSGKLSRPPLRGLNPDDLHRYYGMTTNPNLFLSFHPDYVLTHILEPLAADRTRVICHWLFDPQTMQQPGFDPSDAVETWDLVNRQDWEACEMTQLGMSSRVYAEGGIYAPLEVHIHRFNEWVLGKLGHTVQ